METDPVLESSTSLFTRVPQILFSMAGDQLMNSGGRTIEGDKGKLFLVASLAPI